MTAAFSPQGGGRTANNILGHLFRFERGSAAPSPSRAAQATGIGQEILKQMLPVMGHHVDGWDWFKQSTGGNTGNPFCRHDRPE